MDNFSHLSPSAADMLSINQLAKAQLSPEQVYVFTLRLCDNDVDRDFERFDSDALYRLAELMTGKSGIFDHQWSALGQTARIFRTEVISEPSLLTSAGGPYLWLKGWAYLLRTEKNEPLIAEIDGGIKKEVSISCSASRSVCSVCGALDGECSHVRGQVYDGQLCFMELKDITDAYEWSFVAVPAQRRAGILKRFGLDQGPGPNLQKEAALGRKYLQELRREVVRLAMLADDTLDGQVFRKAASRLDEPELLELKRAFDARAAKRFPPAVQLRRRGGESLEDTADFLV